MAATSLTTALAAHRFGLGAAPGEFAQAGRDGRAWLERQMKDAHIPERLKGLPGSGALVKDLPERGQAAKAPEDFARKGRDHFALELRHRLMSAFSSGQPFVERLTHFWSNHFTVSLNKAVVTYFAGAYEREAIRPNLFGSFADLLIAATRHPAMQLYLDNAYSIGPNSPAGQRSGRGLNENHGREILELQTVSVAAGFTQADVAGLAKILTGWSIDRGPGRDGGRVDPKTGFGFFPLRHEPGPKELLGKIYEDEDGEKEGIQALRDLARHPMTARFVSAKMARHFLTDEPDEGTVGRLERVFLSTGGDLKALTLALLDEPSAWTPSLVKVRSPIEFVTAAVRAVAGDAVSTIDDSVLMRLAGTLQQMGQMPFRAPSPKGWSDRSADWASADAVMDRIEWAHALAEQLKQVPNPAELAKNVLGPLLSKETAMQVSRAPTGPDGLALMLVAPEFMRR